MNMLLTVQISERAFHDQMELVGFSYVTVLENYNGVVSLIIKFVTPLILICFL